MPPKKRSTKVKLAEQKVSNDQHTTNPSRRASETSFSGPDKLFDDDSDQERQGASDFSKPKKDKKWKLHNPLRPKKRKSNHQHFEEITPSPQSEEGNKRRYHIPYPSSGVPSEIEQHENESLVGVSTLSESPPRPSANRVPSLECYSRPMEEQLSPVDGSAHTDLLSSPMSEDEEEGRITGAKKPPDITGMERAAQKARDSGAKFLPKINKLRDDLFSTKQKLELKQSALEDLLSSKESAFNILRKKLDQRDMDEKHLKMKLDDMKESYEEALRNKEKLHKDALEQEQRIYEGKLADKEQELKDKLALAKDQYEAVVQRELATKEELQKLQQDFKGIKQELLLRESEKKQLDQQLASIREEHALKLKQEDERIEIEKKAATRIHAPSTSSLDRFETDCACKGPEHEADLKATLKKKDEEIQSLSIQLQAFQEVSSQRQKLHEHSKTQSTVVVQLRKDLEAAQQELEVIRSKSESAKTIEALHKMIVQLSEELRDLKLEKNGVEDELDVLKKECEAAEKAHQSARHELAQSQSSVASLRAVQEKGKATLVADEGCDLTEMNILRGRARLYQIEVEELQRKEKRYKAKLSELGKTKMAQERKLKDLQEERDLLAQQNMHLLATKQTYKGQLDKFCDLKSQSKITQEHVSALAETIVTKTEEIEALEVKVKGLEDELEATKFQAFQYEQDFEEERQARADAVGARNSDYGQFSHQVQSLTEQLEQAKSETEIERKEKQAVISKLEVNIATSQRLNRQFEQAERDFNQALEAKSEELKNEKTDNTQLKTSLTKLQEQNTELLSNVAKLQEQLQRAETIYLQRQDELLQQLKDFEHEAEHREGELQEKAQMIAVQKLSLNEQLEKVTEELKAKEKQLEIMATEKQVLEKGLNNKTEHNAALTQELFTVKASRDQLASELQQSCERLDSAFADSAHLYDEVLAKTAQVKQYKKQTDSFKIKVEESNDKLLGAHLDLQQCQRLIKTMEGDQRMQQTNLKGLQEQNQMLLNANIRLKARLVNDDELAPYNISDLPKLGECHGSGSYGSVYSVQLNGIKCIAKRVHDILLGQGREEAVRLEDKCAVYRKFRLECVLLSRMRHPNIVQFMGVQYGPEREYGRELTLVMEHLYINLEDCIKRYQNNMEMWLKLSILLDVLKGLSHLHSENIIHRDLTATNILLTTSFHAKIADLGVSKIINVHPLMASKQSKLPGTLGYMPPEALAIDPQYHSALDIFSFGVVMLYLVIQEFPQFYENVLTPTCVQRGEVQIQKRRVWIDKLAPNDSIRQIICHCLQDDPHKRPTIAQLSINLLQLTQQYPKPYSDIMDLLRQQPHRAYYQHGQIRTQSSNPALSPRPLPH